MPTPTDPECPFCKQYPLVTNHEVCNTDEIWLHVLWCARCGARGEVEVEPDTDVVVRTEWKQPSRAAEVAKPHTLRDCERAVREAKDASGRAGGANYFR